MPIYPESRIVKKLEGADSRRDMLPFCEALESGECSYLPSLAALRQVQTRVYKLGATPIGVEGVGVFQWDPTSSAADNNSTVIRPAVGPAATGAGRWVRPTPSTQVIGAGTPGSRLFALADHVHPMSPAGVETGLIACIPFLPFIADNTGAEVVVTQVPVPFDDMVEANIKVRLMARARSAAGVATVRIRLGGTLDAADGTLVASSTVGVNVLTALDFNATIARPVTSGYLKITLQSSGNGVDARVGEMTLSLASA